MMMMMSIYLVVVLVVLMFSSSSSFSISGSSNIISPVRSRSRGGQLLMGNNAKFGIFSPAVIAAKYVIGEAKLNKLRGKAIALHSQAITEWCLQYGAYNLRLKLIQKAKKNG